MEYIHNAKEAIKNWDIKKSLSNTIHSSHSDIVLKKLTEEHDHRLREIHGHHHRIRNHYEDIHAWVIAFKVFIAVLIITIGALVWSFIIHRYPATPTHSILVLIITVLIIYCIMWSCLTCCRNYIHKNDMKSRRFLHDVHPGKAAWAILPDDIGYKINEN